MTYEQLEYMIKQIAAYTGIGTPERTTFYTKDGQIHYKIYSSSLYIPKDISKSLDNNYEAHIYDEPNNYGELQDTLSDYIKDIQVDNDEGYIDFVPLDQKIATVIKDSYIKPFNRKVKDGDICLLPNKSVLNEDLIQELNNVSLTVIHEAEDAEQEQANNNGNDTNSDKPKEDPKDVKPKGSLLIVVTECYLAYEKADGFKVLRDILSSAADFKAPDGETEDFSIFAENLLKEGEKSGNDICFAWEHYNMPDDKAIVHSYLRLGTNSETSESSSLFEKSGVINSICEGLKTFGFTHKQFLILDPNTVAGLKKGYEKIYYMDLSTPNHQIKALDDIGAQFEMCTKYLDGDEVVIKPASVQNLISLYENAYRDFKTNYVDKGAFNSDLVAPSENDNKGEGSGAATNKDKTEEDQEAASNTAQSNASQSSTTQNNAANTANTAQNGGEANGAQANESYKHIRNWWLAEANAETNISNAVNGAVSTAKNATVDKAANVAGNVSNKITNKLGIGNFKADKKVRTARQARLKYETLVQGVDASTKANVNTEIAMDLYYSPHCSNDPEKYQGQATKTEQSYMKTYDKPGIISGKINWNAKAYNGGAVEGDATNSVNRTIGIKKTDFNIEATKANSTIGLEKFFAAFCGVNEGIKSAIAKIIGKEDGPIDGTDEESEKMRNELEKDESLKGDGTEGESTESQAADAGADTSTEGQQ